MTQQADKQADRQAHKQSYKERERERREQDILQMAGQLMAERGYDNLTCADLADAVGISKPTLYLHFKNKDDLTAQVIIRAMQALEDYLAKSSEQSAIERLEGTLQMLIEARCEPAQTMALLGTEIILGAIRRDPQVAEGKARLCSLLTAIVEDGKHNGEIAADISSAAIVRTIFCLQAAAGMITVDKASADYQEAVRSVLQIFLYGITPRIPQEPAPQRLVGVPQ